MGHFLGREKTVGPWAGGSYICSVALTQKVMQQLAVWLFLIYKEFIFYIYLV